MDVTPRESFEAMDFRPGHADTRKLGSRVNSLPTRLHSDSRTRSGRGSPQQEEEESLTGWIREQPRAEMQYSLYESLNYETVMSKLYLNHLRVREQQESRKFYGFTGVTLGRWALTLLTGLSVGLIAYGSIHAIDWITRIKIDMLESAAAGSGGSRFSGRDWGALINFMLFNLMLTLGAAIPVILFAPEAAGSGIPEVMAYLNGVNMPNVFKFSTLVAKVWGTILVVASGIAVGPEGPLVHTGAIIGSGLTSAYKRLVGGSSTGWHYLSTLHNDATRRDLVSEGAAAGFAAAFGAPIGGVLFAFEEASTFFSPKLMWRCLTCTSLSCFTLSLIRAWEHADAERRPGGSSFEFDPGMLMLSTSKNLGFSSQWELILCALEGALGGFLGALFNRLHGSIAMRRSRIYMKTHSTKTARERTLSFARRMSNKVRTAVHQRSGGTIGEPVACESELHEEDQDQDKRGLNRDAHETCCSVWRIRLYRLLEVVILSVVTSAITFGLPYIGARAGWACHGESLVGAHSANALHAHRQHKSLAFYCDGQMNANETDNVVYYNDMATVFLTTRENSILQIIESPHRFSYTSLIMITVTFFFLTLVSFGASFPAGIFMPTIIMGVTLGAIFGKATKDAACVLSCFINPACECLTADEKSPIRRAGPYALLGAVAMLGGIQRSSLSLVVIIVEGTGKVDYLLPIIITTVVAKWVGDRLNEGLYHTTLELKGVPFLGRLEDMPNSRLYTAETTAADIMSAPVVCLHECETVERILSVLAGNTFHGFPVVNHPSASKHRLPIFRGLILRHQLRVLLARKHFYTTKLDLDRSPTKRGVLLSKLRPVNTIRPSGIAAVSRGVPPRQSPSGRWGRSASVNRNESAESRALNTSFDNRNVELNALVDDHDMVDDERGSFEISEGMEVGMDSRGGSGKAEHEELGFKEAPARGLGVAAAVVVQEADERAQIHADMVSSAYEHGAQETQLMQRSIESLSNAELQLYINIDEAMNPVPIHVKASCPLERVHNIFRGLSLRHLIVTDDYNCVVGIITRENLIQAVAHSPEYEEWSDDMGDSASEGSSGDRHTSDLESVMHAQSMHAGDPDTVL